METIFYLSTIVFLMMELGWLVAPVEKTKKANKYFELAKVFKGKEWKDFSEEYKSLTLSLVSLGFSMVTYWIIYCSMDWVFNYSSF